VARPDRAPMQSRRKVREAIYDIRSLKNYRKLFKEATKPDGNLSSPIRNNLPRRNPDV